MEMLSQKFSEEAIASSTGRERKREKRLISSSRPQDPQVSHICYADDVLVFADCSIRNARSLNSINRAKCSITFSASRAGIKRGVLEILRFQEVQLPIKDFGLPLISSRIKYSDSIPLLEKSFKRIGNWKARFLS